MLDWLGSTLESWKFVLTVLTAIGGIVTWWYNERSKRLAEQIKRKEDSYRELLKNLDGFSVIGLDPAKAATFLHHLNQLWLYAPDDVIKSAYRLLESIETGKPHSDEEKLARLGCLVVSIRRDMLDPSLVTTTRLTEADFRFLAPTPRA